MSLPIIVLKLGGSVLASEQSLPLAVAEIYRWLRDGYRVVAVVSALGGATDGLIARARAVSPEPDDQALAALLATGEQTSAPLLALALDRAGVPATVLDAAHISLLARGPVLDAEPVSLDVAALRRELDRVPVVVVPGFVARHQHGGLSVLGRGGSDLSALFLGAQLGAPVRLLKDVPGLFERDPNAPGPRPAIFARLGWDDALRLDGRIVQHKAVRFARTHRQAFTVGSLNGTRCTTVGSGPAAARRPDPADRPLGVGLLGLGTVNLGVLRLIEQHPEAFRPVAIAVRHLRKHADTGPNAELLTTDAWAVIASDADVIVEAIGGCEPALALLSAAIRAGKHVVTANKAVIAHHGPALTALARQHNVTLRFTASVGGAVPVLETIASLRTRGDITRVRGVINGTCNFILDRVAEGVTFDEALHEAQRRGLAEADPSADLSGADAACKLALICREAFGVDVPLADIATRGIAGVRTAAGAPDEAGVLRLVATAERTCSGVRASVRPELLPADHPLAGARREENRVLIEHEGGEPVLLRGRGAGRWPTAQAVLGDLLDLARAVRQQSPAPEQTEAPTGTPTTQGAPVPA